MAKVFFFALLFWAATVNAEDAWFSAKFPIDGDIYAVKTRIHTKKNGDTLEFSSELRYNAIDTSFSMHTTGAYNLAANAALWQNTVRTGLYSVEWTFKDFRDKPAAVHWRGVQDLHVTTFENDAIPEEFLYFLTSKIDKENPYQDLKVLHPAWEMPFKPEAWITSAKYTGQLLRIRGVDCYQVLYTRSDGASAEYYITVKGKQVWRFQTFRGVWFDRVQ